MRAEVIAIGDELTSGQRLDTNSQWLSQQLGDLGLETCFHTTVGDDLAANVQAFRLAASRAEIVVCTGGLGPTLDDLTRQAMADAFDRPLYLDADSLSHIQQMFASRDRAMPDRNRIQAMFPEGSQVIANPHGSAPGIDLEVVNEDSATRFFALPGVPAEMKQMWRESVLPRIESMQGHASGPLHYHTVKVFGIGESDVEVRLPTLTRRHRQPAVGITVSRATISLRIFGHAASRSEFEAEIAPTLQEIEAALGDLIFGAQQDELQHVVMGKLREAGLTMATLEIGAASWIGDWMLAVNEHAANYAGSLALPSLKSAMSWLGSDEQPASLTEPLCHELLRELQARFRCDVALLVASYPSSSEMEQAQDPFTLMFALQIGDTVYFRSRRMGGHPDVLGPRIAKTGLDLARRGLAGLPVE